MAPHPVILRVGLLLTAAAAGLVRPAWTDPTVTPMAVCPAAGARGDFVCRLGEGMARMPPCTRAEDCQALLLWSASGAEAGPRLAGPGMGPGIRGVETGESGFVDVEARQPRFRSERSKNLVPSTISSDKELKNGNILALIKRHH